MMKRMLILVLILLFTSVIHAQEATMTLRELAANDGMYIGAAISTRGFLSNSDYRALAEQELNAITPENMFKFGELSSAPGKYSWSSADKLVDWAEENDMRIHGHTLVWHNQQPGYISEDVYSPQQLEDILHEHITTLVSRYAGRVQEWDVVNEAIDDNAQMRDTIWYRAIGEDYIAKAFQWAHEADPDALLYYNDYNIITSPRKADAIYEMVKGLVDAGVPINGVGFQAHLRHQEQNRASTARVRALMDRFGELGLRVNITEMDVRLQDNGGRDLSDMLDLQAEIYANVVQACLDAPNCDTVTAWGLGDTYSWIPGFTGNPDWPLLFDENLQPKPAYYAVADVLAQGQTNSDS